MTDAFMHQHRTPVGPWRFISGSICPSNPFERELSFASPSKRAADSPNFWRPSNTDAPVYLPRLAISHALQAARARATGKRSFQIDWQRLASFRTFGWSISNLQLICQIYRLICDRSHIHASYDGPGEQWNNRPWWIACFPNVHALRWLGTVVTSHTVSHSQAYTPLMSMLQRAVQVFSAPRAINQQTHKCQNGVRSKVLIVRQRSILMQDTAK